MFPTLPFEYPVRQRAIPYEDLAKMRKVQEQRDRELEEFLSRVCLKPCGSGGGLQVALRIKIDSPALTGSLGDYEDIPLSAIYGGTDGWETHLAHAYPDNTVEVITEGWWRATLVVRNQLPTQIVVEAASSVPISFDAPVAAGNGVPGGPTIAGDDMGTATAVLLYPMAAGDTFTPRVAVDDTTVEDGYFYVEYAGPLATTPEG